MIKSTLIIILTLLSIISPSLSYAEVIHSERSLYRKIFVEDNNDIRCLKFSVKRKTSSQSCINKKRPQELVFNYSKLLFSSLLLLEKPQNVLIIGLGGGTMSNSIHQLFPDARITNVEIDSAVVKVAREYFDFIENDKITTEIKDGRIFIKRAKIKKEQYDWIILDAFNGDYIPEHLMTQEFLSEINSVLAENGVLAANTFSNSELYNYESATYYAVFNHFYNVRFNKHSNRVILSKKGALPTSKALLKKAHAMHEKISAYNVNLPTLVSLMDDTIDWPIKTRLLTDQYSPANLIK